MSDDEPTESQIDLFTHYFKENQNWLFEDDVKPEEVLILFNECFNAFDKENQVERILMALEKDEDEDTRSPVVKRKKKSCLTQRN